MVSISYCITTHNEGAIYLRPLFERLLKYLQPEDEIVVVDDNSTEETTIQTLSVFEDRLNLHQHSLLQAPC